MKKISPRRSAGQQVQRGEKVNLQRILLQTVAMAGFLSVALLAPNALVVFKDLGLIPGKRHLDAIEIALKRMLINGMLRVEGNRLTLTAKGVRCLDRYLLHEYEIPTPYWWDKHWHMLIFDITERKKKIRNEIRFILADVGFVWVQDSVWIYPYPCEDFVQLLKAKFILKNEVRYLIIKTLENDLQFRKHFGLTIT